MNSTKGEWYLIHSCSLGCLSLFLLLRASRHGEFPSKEIALSIYQVIFIMCAHYLHPNVFFSLEGELKARLDWYLRSGISWRRSPSVSSRPLSAGDTRGHLQDWLWFCIFPGNIVNYQTKNPLLNKISEIFGLYILKSPFRWGFQLSLCHDLFGSVQKGPFSE